MKQDRLFQIIYILLDKKIVSAPELAEKFEVSVRTIYRDVDTLSASGIPIYALSGKNGGISLMPNYTFNHSLLTDKEQNEMLFALQSMKASDQNVDVLLNKLGTLFKKENQSWIEVDFSRWGHKKVDADKFDKIRQGILNKQLLEIYYLDSYGKESQRNIKPVKLIFKQSNWYLQAFCLKAQDFRTFKVNRIATLILLDEYYNDIDGANGVDGVFENNPPIDGEIMQNDKTTTLKLKVSASMAFRVYDEFLPSDVEKLIDGSLVVTATLPIDGWIYNYILSFGEGVEVLEPIAIKHDLIKYLEKLQKHFKS